MVSPDWLIDTTSVDGDGDARPLLDGVLADEPGVVRRTAGEDDDAVDADEELVEALELRDRDATILDAPANGVRDGLGLLRDLLRHEARPAALVGGGGVPRHLEGLGFHAVALEVGDGDLVGRDGDDLVLTDRERAAGVLHERGDVGSEEVLPVAQADDER
jgi:hypothetical protein